MKESIEKALERAIKLVLNALERLGIDAAKHAEEAGGRAVKEASELIDSAAERVVEEVKDAVEEVKDAVDAVEEGIDRILHHAANPDGGDTDPKIHFPDPSKIIHEIEGAATSGLNSVKNAVENGVNTVHAAAMSGVHDVEDAGKKALDDAEQAVETALHSIIEGIESGALKKAMKLLETTEHTGFSVSFGPVGLSWDDVSKHYDELQKLADDPPTTHAEVLDAIKGVAPDSVSITADVNLFSSDLGAGFTVTFDVQDFIDHADALLSDL